MFNFLVKKPVPKTFILHPRAYYDGNNNLCYPYKEHILLIGNDLKKTPYLLGDIILDTNDKEYFYIGYACDVVTTPGRYTFQKTTHVLQSTQNQYDINIIESIKMMVAPSTVPNVSRTVINNSSSGPEH